MSNQRPVESPGNQEVRKLLLRCFLLDSVNVTPGRTRIFAADGFMILSPMILSLSFSSAAGNHFIPKLLSQPTAACFRPFGQIRPNQTTFFAAPQSMDKRQRRSVRAKATSARVKSSAYFEFSCLVKVNRARSLAVKRTNSRSNRPHLSSFKAIQACLR
jgi:hypothetical protein